MFCFVDSDHAGNVVTRQSPAGILIFLQNTLTEWHSKKQNTIESSSYGSEFAALRIAHDMIVALWYKLQMFGVPLKGPASVLCDNQGVVKMPACPNLSFQNSIMPQITMWSRNLQQLESCECIRKMGLQTLLMYLRRSWPGDSITISFVGLDILQCFTTLPLVLSGITSQTSQELPPSECV